MRPDSTFGDVPFSMIIKSGSQFPDWETNLKVVEHHMVGGSVTETEVIGQGRLRLSVLVRCRTTTDFSALMAKMGTEDTLTMRHTATAWPGDAEGQDLDGLYKQFHNVMLTTPIGMPRLHRNGVVDISVTFERDPA